MSKQFLKKGEVKLVNGGYLSNKDGKPVFNALFVKAQQHAEYITTFAEMAKKKNFKEVKVDTVDALKSEVLDFLNKSKPVHYILKPDVVEKPLTAKLADEALTFMNFQEDTDKVNKINAFLQQFTILSEFEEFGLFFEEDVVKLSKIYSMKEVIDAVTETIELLD
jgi:hypothetical protein